MRDGNSPSWFNAVEVVQVIKYIQGLLASTSPVIGPDDIGVITPYRKQVWTIELYMNIRTRGHTGDAACTNATGLQGDMRAILLERCMHIEYEVQVGVLVLW